MSRFRVLTIALMTTACALAALLGWRTGLGRIPPDETAIINRLAAQYVQQTGGAPTDCHGEPSNAPGVRLVVICGADHVFAVDRWGRDVEGGT